MRDDTAPAITWHKSTHSNTEGQCVEVSSAHGVRDSKLGDDSPVLSFSVEQLAAFITDVRDGALG